MKTDSQKHRVVFFLIALLGGAVAVVSPLVVASCSTQQRAPQDVAAAVERLRTMTRGGVSPAESVVAGIETEYAGTRAGALARLLRGRLRFAANDFNGAASLLDTNTVGQHTTLGDYALYMRARSLEQLGRGVEARAAYEQLAREFPASLRAREATLKAAELMLKANQEAGVATALKKLSDADDAAALLLTAKAYEQQGDSTRALGAYRRIHFYAPASVESAEAASAIVRLNSTPAPATDAEALARATRLFDAKRYAPALEAYTDAFARFPATSNTETRLRRGVAAANAQRAAEAIAALNAVPASAGEMRAEALHHLAQVYARSRQWEMTRATLEEMRRNFPQSAWTMRALVAAGQAAKDAKNNAEAANFYRSAATLFTGASEVAGGQFELAWAAHESKNFAESSRLLIEHLAEYADENTDNRGRAGYWAARDAERAGRTAEAHAIYEAMQARYDANWYGYLAKQRLDTMARNGVKPPPNFAPDATLARAVANLKPVTVAEETAGRDANERIAKADELNAVGLDEWAHAELDDALRTAPTSPRLNLAKARLFRQRDDNVQAFNVLRRSYPDYSQMKPEEMSPEVWDVFYPLAFWDIITQEARARSLDPYMVAGLIRQESVFNPRAASHANAHGLMQLLPGTGRLVAQRYGVGRPITVESLYEPRLNIQLGTGYMRDQLDKYGRIEYLAAAYNAGPGRVVTWRATLPLEIDEWAEAIPFRETRGYVQGVVRNMMQYRRLYDEQGRFRPEVGTRAINGDANTPAQQQQPAGVRLRRATGNQEEE